MCCTDLLTHLEASSSDDSFLEGFSSKPNTRLSMQCVSSPDLGGMKVTRGSQFCSQFGRHTPRFVVFFQCIPLETKLTLMIQQCREKANKYMNKLFPLYDNLVGLCNAVIVTGVSAFRGTCHGSSDHDAEGSEDDKNRVDWLASEEKGLDWFDNLVHKFTL